jgi:hypothetical protein
MTIRFVTLLVAVATFAAPAVAELVHGTVDLSSCRSRFDFSEQSCPVWACSDDLAISPTYPPVPFPWRLTSCLCGNEGFWICHCESPSVVAIIPGATLDEVELAPEDSTEYACQQWVAEETVYVIRTFDGVYAKFVFTELPLNAYKIDYVVQTDGSRKLGGVPVARSSWGVIKVLYE